MLTGDEQTLGHSSHSTGTLDLSGSIDVMGQSLIAATLTGHPHSANHMTKEGSFGGRGDTSLSEVGGMHQ